jgi:uncharacterized membrane protein
MRSQGEPDQAAGDRKFRTGLPLVVGSALLLYPVLVYFGQIRFGTRWVAGGLIAIGVLRLIVSRLTSGRFETGRALGGPEILLICGGAIALGIVSVWRSSPAAILYYPAVVNAILLLIFATSLVRPPTVVERIARSRDRDLPRGALPYLRRVTASWCAFFLVNGAIALYTATRTSFETWALYNGFIAYLLIGAMFAGEFLTRMRVMRSLRK